MREGERAIPTYSTVVVVVEEEEGKNATLSRTICVCECAGVCRIY